jgi:hypothetical protein
VKIFRPSLPVVIDRPFGSQQECLCPVWSDQKEGTGLRFGIKFIHSDHFPHIFSKVHFFAISLLLLTNSSGVSAEQSGLICQMRQSGFRF